MGKRRNGRINSFIDIPVIEAEYKELKRCIAECHLAMQQFVPATNVKLEALILSVTCLNGTIGYSSKDIFKLALSFETFLTQ